MEFRKPEKIVEIKASGRTEDMLHKNSENWPLEYLQGFSLILA